MIHSTRTQQRGITFIGLLIIAALMAMAGVVLAQSVPTFVEFLAVQKAVQTAASGQTPDEVRSKFEKASEIDNITSITPKDLEITKEADKVVVSFAYQREIHLVGPAYLTYKYQGRSK